MYCFTDIGIFFIQLSILSIHRKAHLESMKFILDGIVFHHLGKKSSDISDTFHTNSQKQYIDSSSFFFVAPQPFPVFFLQKQAISQQKIYFVFKNRNCSNVTIHSKSIEKNASVYGCFEFQESKNHIVNFSIVCDGFGHYCCCFCCQHLSIVCFKTFKIR